MEIVVGALVVLGFLAIVARFVTRDASGEIRLPRVVDDSIGMWTLRRITGRRLGERTLGEGADDDLKLDPNAADATRARLAAIAAANAPNRTIDVAAGPPPATAAATAPRAPARSAPALDVAPVRRAPAGSAASRRRAKGRPVGSSSMTSPTPVLDLRRRQEARLRQRKSPWPRRIATLASIAAVVIVAVVVVVALGSRFQPLAPQGKVLAATGRPQSASGSVSVAGAASEPPSSISPVALTRDVTRPKAAITGLTRSTIQGNTKLRVALTWTLTDSGSGLRRQLLQRRTDGGAWVTVSLASVSTRKAAFALSRGHTYAFRIRATDRAGNVGSFVSRSIRT